MRMFRCSCLLLLLVFGAMAQDWPQFRGPRMDGVSSVEGLPTIWSAQKNRVWKLELPGGGASQPITRGDRIFVTSYSGYAEKRGRKAEKTDPTKLMLHVSCINSKDGALIWRQDLKPLGPVVEHTQKVNVHGYATPTPILDDEMLYASFGTAGVFALSPSDGAVKWRMVPGTICHRWGYAASLAVCDDLLLINASSEANNLIAIDKRTGKECWRNNEAMITKSKYNRSWSTPMVFDTPGGGKQILLLNLNTLCAYDPKTGKTIWTHPTRQGYSGSNPTWHGDIIYAVVGSGHGRCNSRALKMDPKLDPNERELWHNKDNGACFSSSVYLDGKLYYASFSGKEHRRSVRGFCCMDAKTGEMIYKENPVEHDDLGKRASQFIYAPSLAGDGKLYYVSQTLGVYVVAAQSEFRLLAMNKLADDPSWFNAPAIPLSGGRLLLRSDWGLHCLGGTDSE